MDLIFLVLGIALIGFIVWIIETQVPMPAIFKTIIYVVVGIALIFFVVRMFAGHVPNVMGWMKWNQILQARLQSV